MQSGELSERIEIKKRGSVPDGCGGYEDGLTAIDSDPMPWAKIEPASGSERLFAMQMQMERYYRVTVRARTDLRSDYVVIWGGDEYEIKDLVPFRQGEEFISFTMAGIDGTA